MEAAPAEVSITVAPGASVRWETFASETWGPLDVPPGAYRLRVNARGRDLGPVAGATDLGVMMLRILLAR